MKKITKIVFWILAGFMALSAIVFFPSIASIFMVLFAVIVAPIPALQKFWDRCGVNKWKKSLILIVLFIVSISFAPTDTENNQDTNNNSQPKSQVEATKEPEEMDAEPESFKTNNEDDIRPSVSLDMSDYMKIDSDILFEYGSYMAGQKVVTVITIASKSGTSLKANTDSDDSFFYSMSFEFDQKSEAENVEKDDTVTIAGAIKEDSSFLSTVSLEHCVIVGAGEIAQELTDGVDAQRQTCEQFKQAYEAEIATAAQAEKDDYISQCETVDYSDVERNPDDYDGTKVKISGKVVQVSEGWFDNVTLRIDCGGNVWYVTYSRSDGESRILENDNITCYGECTGVTSYTTVLGAQVTIPSMKMQYYD